ncbi:sacsin N-terminal ATP-binding-like domain-containing protein [Hymenobacter nivis]|uniref:Protein NO VEIN C-terminal domain-containing protein n=1 Tax=Hymenobacter nivis TaxID=1850093 RepID=A0A2Z3GTV5_9BACT|nr:hypothetical protein [Hymenobacter nivis]AWM32120.1 hypothetical protein DDQ68_04510 [Hymenobacter nivis]
MAELSDFEQSQLDNNYKLSADKILQILDQVRNDGELSKRRWVWELLQNAKDLSPQRWERGVSVALELTDEALTFRHNGDPFTAKQLTSLVQQVSSKPPGSEDADITGKFGTGFISTHLLSDVIVVSGYVARANGAHRGLEMKLDRSGKTSEALQASIKQALEKLPQDDRNPAFPWRTDYEAARRETDLDTAFCYQLNTPANRAAAVAGLDDLINALPATLVNLHGKIKQVRVRHANGSEETYTCNKVAASDAEGTATPGIVRYGVTVQHSLDASHPKHHCFVAYEQTEPVRLRLLAPVDNFTDLVLAPDTDSEPRLYRDFPLIGTERFYLPFVLNGQTLFPTERRDSVFLNNADPAASGDKPSHNRTVLEAGQRAALVLSHWLLEQPTTRNRFVLARTHLPEPRHLDDLALRNWYKPLQRSYRALLLDMPLVESAAGTSEPLRTVRVPRHRLPTGGTPKAADHHALWELTHDYLGAEHVPTSDLQARWIEALGVEAEMESWQLPLLLDARQLVELVATHPHLDQLPCGTDTASRLAWLNRLYEFLAQQQQLALLHDHAVVPNQENELRKLGELWLERGTDPIAPPVLNVLEELGLPWRNELLHLGVRLPDDTHKSRGLSDASGAISDALKVGEQVEGLDASFLRLPDAVGILVRMLQLTSPSARDNNLRRQLFSFAKQLLHFEEDLLEVPYLATLSFERASELLVLHLNTQITRCGNLAELATQLGNSGADSETAALAWLNGYLGFLAKSSKMEPLLKIGSIVPNRKKELRPYAELHNAGTPELPLDDTLLRILKACDEKQDWEPKLLAKGVDLTLLNSYTFDQLGNDLVSFANKVLYADHQHENNRAELLDLLGWCLNPHNDELAKRYLTQFRAQAASTYFRLTVERNGKSEEVLELMRHEGKLSDLAAIARSEVDLKKLLELVKLAPSNDLLTQVVRNAKQLQDDYSSFRFLQRIGALMEKAFAAALTKENITVRIESGQDSTTTVAQIDYKGIGSYDFVIHNADLVNFKAFYLELKSYSTSNAQPIRLARSQAKRAAENKDPFALCVIGRDKPAEEVDEEYVRQNLVYVVDISQPLQPVYDDIAAAERLEKTPQDNVWLDVSALHESKVFITHKFISTRQQTFTQLIGAIKAVFEQPPHCRAQG